MNRTNRRPATIAVAGIVTTGRAATARDTFHRIRC